METGSCVHSVVLIIALVAINLAIIYMVMAAPLGVRSFTLRKPIDAPRQAVWEAIWPLGIDAGWSGEIVEAQAVAGQPDRAEIALSWPSRDGSPIRRTIEFADLQPGIRFSMRVTEDSSLDSSFWQHYSQDHDLTDEPAGRTILTRRTTDRYHGLAFFVFRYFAARREMRKLRIWAETGRYRPGGIFEHPLTQFAMASLSAVILWPLFGLTTAGFIMAATLTLVIAAHEFGHMLAFRMMGHGTARMIFIPILGGVAIGGRPYDRRYEIAFVALMGSGFSALLFPAAYFAHIYASDAGAARMALVFGGLAACIAFFNLANLAPVWRFDGGQIIRQIFTERGVGRPLASFLLSSMVMGFAWLAGYRTGALIAAGAVLSILGVMTANSGVKPRHDMKPMTPAERWLIAAGLVSVYIIHGSGVVWATRHFL